VLAVQKTKQYDHSRKNTQAIMIVSPTYGYETIILNGVKENSTAIEDSYLT